MTGHPIRHPREIHDARTFSQRAADRMAAVIGSWPFLIGQSLLLVAWFLWNGVIAVHALHGGAFDPAPFFIANLCMSAQASITGPALLISSNRQAAIDRKNAENAYHHVDLIDQKQDAQLQCLAAQDVVMERQHREQTRMLDAIFRALDLAGDDRDLVIRKDRAP